MQNIKNFRLTDPTPELAERWAAPDGTVPLFLTSEDGQDWYDCQKDFAGDTVKVMYKATGAVLSVVDRPVPERGNTLAVSMLWPVNMSVAEVASLPDEFCIDGTWIYSDGTVTQSADLLMAKNRRTLVRSLNKAVNLLTMYQIAAQEGDNALVQALQQYIADLRSVDLTQQKPVWPPLPAL